METALVSVQSKKISENKLNLTWKILQMSDQKRFDWPNADKNQLIINSVWGGIESALDYMDEMANFLFQKYNVQI